MLNKNLQKNIVKKNTTITEGIKLLNYLAKKILIVTDNKNRLIGTITDGDIRRFIISKKNKVFIYEIMNKKPKFIYYKNIINLNEKLSSLYKYLPVIDQNKKIIDIIEYKDNFKDIAILIQAGGKGERLRPLTKETPKPLLTVKSQSLLIQNINYLKGFNLNNIYISVNYQKKKIINHLKLFDYKIKFIKEKKFLGTAGSLKKIKDPKYSHILIINADIITNLNLTSLIKEHIKSKADITTAVKENKIYIPYGVVNIHNSLVKSISEKPVINYYFNSGICLFKRRVINLIKNNERIDMPSLINKSINSGMKIKPYLFSETWIDVGTKENLINLDIFYKNKF
jgi:dTDP-glucose pyrophosphorylase